MNSENKDPQYAQIESGYLKLLGRTPTQSEMLELVHIKDALSLRGDDPLWLILYALQHYKDLYKQIPAQINESLARTELLIEKIDAARSNGQIPRAEKLLPSSGKKKKGAYLLVATIALIVGGFAGRISSDNSLARIVDLNGGASFAHNLATCYAGAGQIEKRSDGHTYCFPVSPAGKVLGFITK